MFHLVPLNVGRWQIALHVAIVCTRVDPQCELTFWATLYLCQTILHDVWVANGDQTRSVLLAEPPHHLTPRVPGVGLTSLGLNS